MLDDVLEEFAARDVLHDHEDVGGCADHLITKKTTEIQPGTENLQFDDVRMAEEREILDFAANLADHIQDLDLLPVQHLHGHLVARGLMDAD